MPSIEHGNIGSDPVRIGLSDLLVLITGSLHGSNPKRWRIGKSDSELSEIPAPLYWNAVSRRLKPPFGAKLKTPNLFSLFFNPKQIPPDREPTVLNI